MGGGVGKVKKEPQPDKKGGKSKRGSLSGCKGGIFDVLPTAEQRSLLRGVLNDGPTPGGFTDKDVEQEGADLGLKIGYACKKGLKPDSPNQDDFCIYRADKTFFYGVFDGHGPFGHDIANFVQETLPLQTAQRPCFASDLPQALREAFIETHRTCVESQMEFHFDCSLSGATATLAVLRDGHLHTAHVGDCRAVLGKKHKGEFVAEELTRDHKPHVEEERARIQASGGQIACLEGDVQYRVFLNGKIYPGMTMTRAIGDMIGCQAGVTSIPDVSRHKVQKDWRFLLLCSDGVWEFVTSDEAVDIVSRHSSSNAQKAAENLASTAWNRWIKEEGNLVDDITVICAWFVDRPKE